MSWTKSSRFIKIVSVLWVVLIWLWVILFFASNWDQMSNLFKVAILFIWVLAAYISWFYLYYKKEWFQKTWYALILLGAILYGSSIFLLWQIYNLWWTFYEAMRWWFIWVLPLAYVTWFWWVLILSIILFYMYIFGYIDEYYRYNDWLNVIVLVSAISLFFINLAKLHTAKKYLSFDLILSIVWIFWVFGAFFLMTFDDILRFNQNDIFPIWLIWVFLWASLLFKMFYHYKNKSFDWKSDLWNLLHTLILLKFTFFMVYGFGDYGNYLLIFFNIYFMVMILFTVYLGTIKHKVYLINISLFFFVIFMIAKYFDWFYDMFDRSLFFMAWWLLLLIWWFFLEKRRKKLLDKLQ